ncbi:hypothetical protein LOC68_13125 [Blastopirellula sp. JC732]|uniref:Uncharacterized protein n=1 Tax=Blastopirellula sediminis TaxID=2894196 RepID=A0A9X1MNB0_9BACT|nr:hypothetical protein [Blastopirellula sediminis]MCC9607367.1 hypothetical protein [Blastopirellula sediminis]MCC9629340.1 hypothetical protein [Blastopirellula sediminis]
MGSFVIITEEPYEPGWFSRTFFGATPRPRPPRPEATLDLERTAHQIVDFFVEHGYLHKPLVPPEHSREATYATQNLFTRSGDQLVWADPTLQWHHLAFEPRCLRRDIEPLTQAVTIAESWPNGEVAEGLDPDEIIAPMLDIHLFSRPIELIEIPYDATVGHPWGMIEFQYGDLFHAGRPRSWTEEQPLAIDLAKLFQCRVEARHLT